MSMAMIMNMSVKYIYDIHILKRIVSVNEYEYSRYEYVGI